MKRNFRIEVLHLTDDDSQVTHLITEGDLVPAAKLRRALDRVGAAKWEECSFWWKDEEVLMATEEKEHKVVTVKGSDRKISVHAVLNCQ